MTSSPLRPLVTALVIAGGIALAAPSRAATPSTDEREAQRTDLYRAATKAAAGGHWSEAKEKLRAVLAIRSSPKVIFSLGQAEEELGQLASAQADYARALETAATEGKGDVVQAAEQAQRALGPRVPHLRVVLADGGANGATATLDDQPIAIGTAVAVDPGEHRLVVRAAGMRSATLNVRLTEGQQLDRPVSLNADAAAPPPSAPSTRPRAEETAPAPIGEAARQGSPISEAARQGSPISEAARQGSPTDPPAPAQPVDSEPAANPGATARTAALVVAGVGVIAFGVGAVFGVESMQKHNGAENVCPATACPTANGSALWHDAVTAGNEATVAFVVGGVGLAVGGLVWLTAPKSPLPARVGFGPGSVQLTAEW